MAYDPSNEAEEAAGLLALARQTHEAHVAAAKEKAAGIIARAEEEADAILSNAREEFSWLEQKIAQHREFEARYRAALATYLTELLDEIKQEDEFIAPVAQPSTPVETETEDSAFAVDEDELIETQAAAQAYAEEPVYEEPQTAEEPIFNEPEPESVEESYEELSSSEDAVEEPLYAESEPVYEDPSFEGEKSSDENDEYTYAAAPVDFEEEIVPTFAEGEAPVPPQPDSDSEESNEDLPEVPESIDSYGTAADEIEALENEIQDHGPETREEIENFDELIAGEPKPATDSVAAQAPLFGDSKENVEEADKGVRGFFGFKKN